MTNHCWNKHSSLNVVDFGADNSHLIVVSGAPIIDIATATLVMTDYYCSWLRRLTLTKCCYKYLQFGAFAIRCYRCSNSDAYWVDPTSYRCRTMDQLPWCWLFSTYSKNAMVNFGADWVAVSDCVYLDRSQLIGSAVVGTCWLDLCGVSLKRLLSSLNYVFDQLECKWCSKSLSQMAAWEKGILGKLDHFSIAIVTKR